MDPSIAANRFTLADYDYDRCEEASSSSFTSPIPSTSHHHPFDQVSKAGSSSRQPPRHDEMLRYPPTAASISPPSASSSSAPYRDRIITKQTSVMSSSNSSHSLSTPRLRLHQPEDPPIFTPSTLTTSPTHPLSPSISVSDISSSSFGLGPIVTSPTSSSDIRPLPSIPKSFSTQRSLDTITSSDHTSPTNLVHSGRTVLLSPPILHRQASNPEMSEPKFDILGPSNETLTAPSLAHRHSTQSAISGMSGAWSEHFTRTEGKEKDFSLGPARPALLRGQSGAKVVKWYENFWPASWPCRLLFLTVVLETIINLSIEGNILWRFNAEIDTDNAAQLNYERKRRLPIFLVIYGLAHLWQLVLVVVAIRTRNTIQVNAVTLFNYALLGYAVIQIYELRQILGEDLKDGLNDVGTSETLLTIPLNVLTAIVIAVVATGSIILTVLAVLLRKEFGWQRYRFLGADLQIRKYFFRFQVYECLCYFGAFFCAGFGIQFIWLVLQKTDVEYIITWVAFPLLVLLLVFGRWAARYENHYAMGTFMTGLLVAEAYFIFKLVRIWQQETTTYKQLTKSLTVFDVLSLVSLMACFIYGVIVWRDFGKGLKEAVLNQKKASSIRTLTEGWSVGSKGGGKGEEAQQQEMEVQNRRISID